MYFFYCLIQEKVVSKKGLQILIESEVRAYFLKSYSKENMRLLLTRSVSPVASGRRDGRGKEAQSNGEIVVCTHSVHPVTIRALVSLYLSWLSVIFRCLQVLHTSLFTVFPRCFDPLII